MSRTGTEQQELSERDGWAALYRLLCTGNECPMCGTLHARNANVGGPDPELVHEPPHEGVPGWARDVAQAFIEEGLGAVDDCDTTLSRRVRAFYRGPAGLGEQLYENARVWRGFALYAITRSVMEIARREWHPNWLPANLLPAGQDLPSALVHVQRFSETRLDDYLGGSGPSWHDPRTDGLDILARVALSAARTTPRASRPKELRKAGSRFYGALEAIVATIPSGPEGEEEAHA